MISDEAHRSIGGNARAVFEYFVGYKLGLTATPKDYIKKFDAAKPTTNDPREQERRLLLDTYRTFGCEAGEPTYRYSLLDGVRDGFLINPTGGRCAHRGHHPAAVRPGLRCGRGERHRDGERRASNASTNASFEKKFFSKPTNALFCKTFLENGLRDPISGEIRQDHRLRRQPEPRCQAHANPERDGR